MNGFTLVELLIAMTLTAVIGMVLFSTYSMVMDNGKTVRNRVLERESERVFWGILDNDIAGLCLIDDKRSTLPPLSREPIVPSDAFYRLTETDKPQPSDDEVLLSFATSSHLADMPGTPLPGPVCVEYVLRNGNRSAAFIRRERAHCGVEGDFPWSELVLVRNVKSLEVALYSAKTQFVEDWPSPLPPGALPKPSGLPAQGRGRTAGTVCRPRFPPEVPCAELGEPFSRTNGGARCSFWCCSCSPGFPC